MNKLLIICGPTATGKTALGIKLAKRFNGEIVSADSRQVYISMDIGTGKDFKGAWLLDVIEPNQEFSVAQYLDLAWKVIEDIWKRKKLPIIVGGTGFYIKALVDGIETLGVPPDWELRKQLSNLTIEQLREILRKTCPERLRGMSESDRKNPRRLIRAIEIAIKMKNEKSKKKKPASRGSFGMDKGKFKILDTLFVGLKAPYKILYKRIDQRVDERVKMGVVDEIKKLLAEGYSWNNSVLATTIGYREWQSYFEGKTTISEVVQKWKFAEHSYARRQLTWFKKDKRMNWFDVTIPSFEKKIEKIVSKWYKSKYSLYHFVV